MDRICLIYLIFLVFLIHVIFLIYLMYLIYLIVLPIFSVEVHLEPFLEKLVGKVEQQQNSMCAVRTAKTNTEHRTVFLICYVFRSDHIEQEQNRKKHWANR